MREWWTYRPDDFLLFSARTYWRMFELHNAVLWPLPLAGPLLGIVLLWLAGRRRPDTDRWILAILAVLWLLVGWSFVWNRFAVINWGASYLAPLFAVEAVLLAGIAFDATGHGPRRRRAEPHPVLALGSALVLAGLLAYPLLAPLGDRPLGGAELFGVAPDPTAVATLGFVLLLGRGRAWLLPIPLLWCLVSGATLLTMGEAEGWMPLAAAAVAGLAAALSGRRRRRR
jgi:hypothetical protein